MVPATSRRKMSSAFLPSVLLVLPLLSTVSTTGEGTKDCDAKTAVQCLTYSEAFRSLPAGLQYTECANASKSVSCLQLMVTRCPSLQSQDESLYSNIIQTVANFKKETVGICDGSNMSTPSFAVITSLFFGTWLLHFFQLCIIQ